MFTDGTVVRTAGMTEPRDSRVTGGCGSCWGARWGKGRRHFASRLEDRGPIALALDSMLLIVRRPADTALLLGDWRSSGWRRRCGRLRSSFPSFAIGTWATPGRRRGVGRAGSQRDGDGRSVAEACPADLLVKTRARLKWRKYGNGRLLKPLLAG